MIRIFTRPQCAYCPMVKKYYDRLGVKYEVSEAEGEDYKELSLRFGFSVPLVFNPDNGLGMTGFDVRKLKDIAGV